MAAIDITLEIKMVWQVVGVGGGDDRVLLAPEHEGRWFERRETVATNVRLIVVRQQSVQ